MWHGEMAEPVGPNPVATPVDPSAALEALGSIETSARELADSASQMLANVQLSLSTLARASQSHVGAYREVRHLALGTHRAVMNFDGYLRTAGRRARDAVHA